MSHSHAAAKLLSPGSQGFMSLSLSSNGPFKKVIPSRPKSEAPPSVEAFKAKLDPGQPV